MKTEERGGIMTKEIQEIIEELRQFSTPELCDGAVAYKVMDYQIKPRVNEKKIVGPAVTVQVPTGVSGFIPDAILKLNPGDVLVIAGQGYCGGSYWGGHRSLCARMKGAEGVIIDGAFRDLEGCREVGLPVYARGIIPGSARKESIGQVNVPVVCGGVEVHPGDLIAADENGVCVIRPDMARSVMDQARKKIAAEKDTIEEMKRTGKILPRVLIRKS